MPGYRSRSSIKGGDANVKVARKRFHSTTLAFTGKMLWVSYLILQGQDCGFLAGPPFSAQFPQTAQHGGV